MQGRIEYFPLAGRSCLVWHPAATGPLPVVILPANAPMMAAVPQILAEAEKAHAGAFYLAAFQVEHWQNDCTPWPAPALQKGGEAFGGKAQETLAFIREQLLPAVAARCELAPGPGGCMLAGYSLAGLFALWAGLTCTDFGAVASCSGSLWYDGWADFMETHRAKAPLRVYLSLGSGEAKTRDPRMQSVGVNTHTAEWHCNQDPMVTRYTYKVHPGGHFKDIEKRMASALAWLSR